MCTIPNQEQQLKTLHVLSAVRVKIPSSKAYSKLEQQERNFRDEVALVDISSFEPTARLFDYDEAHAITSNKDSVGKYIIVGVTSSSEVYLIWDGKTHSQRKADEKKPSKEFLSSLHSLTANL